MASETSVWAAAVTPTLGLLGVVFGLVWNARQQAKADFRKFELEQSREERATEHKRNVTRALLRAELKSLAKTFQDEIDYAEHADFTWVPIGNFSVSPDNRSDIGLLTPDEVEAVMNAYFTFQERAGYIIRNGALEGRANDLSTVKNVSYPLVDKGKREALFNDLSAIIVAADAAIVRLAKSNTPASD